MAEERGQQGVMLQVNADKCIGSGMCEMLEEATFLIDEDTNIASTIGEHALPEERATIVIDRCPASAIERVIAEETPA